jgi:predicted RNA methylase
MTTLQDTGKFRKDLSDKYYTSPDVASACIQYVQSVVPNPGGFDWIEPSAGTGVFVDALKGFYADAAVAAVDIAPGRADIETADFLEWTGAEGAIVFGNPPFGRQAATARRFIGRAAEIRAAWIAFILPRSFEKPSMQRAFPLEYHMRCSIRLNSHAFLVNEEPYDVPCVFQVWERKNVQRIVAAPIEPHNFEFVSSTKPYDIVVRRVGVYAGRAYMGGLLPPRIHSPQSHYFIKLPVCNKKWVVERLNQHTFATNTTGPRSLSKGEITVVLGPIISAAPQELPL